MSAPRPDGPWVGRPLPRREDLRFTRGRGEYVDDRPFADVLHMVAVRSVYAHARIVGIDSAAALEVDGVIAVWTGADLSDEMSPLKAALPAPNCDIMSFPLATDVARYCGEPVAVVIATSKQIAEDAAQLVNVDYEPLPPVLDPEQAIEPGAALVHAKVGTNLAWRKNFSYGNVDGAFAAADHIVRRRLHLHRFTSAPLETRQAVVSYNAHSGDFEIFSNLQNPERFRARIAASLGISPDRLRFLCPDIGGAFGIKLHLLWVLLLCVAARRLGRPVKWIEDRSGHLGASHHGNEVLYDAELALRADGEILGLRTRALHDEGAYLEREPKGAVNQLRHSTLTYRFRALEMDFLAVMTNKCPTGPNRSYGKVQQVFLVERMLDEAARELGIDALALRRRNLVQPEQMPYQTPSGAIYDGGDYPRLLALLESKFDFAEFRRRQAGALSTGRRLGVGIAMGIEGSPSNNSLQQLIDPADNRSSDSEAALVRIGLDARIFVAVGSVPQGQGHETTISQIVADELAVTPGEVDVTVGYDSLRDPSTPFSGTHASRFAVMGGGAVVGACRAMRKRLVRLAAHLLESDAQQLTLKDGAVRAADGRSIGLAELARVANLDLARLPPDTEPGLEQRFIYHAPMGHPSDAVSGNFSISYASGATLVEVSVDLDTGRVRLERIIAVHDCGVQINPLIVEGLVHGAIAHQVGAALFEKIEYDDQGQLMTSTFKNYLTPTAIEMPRYECDHIETPSLFAALGARGAAEGAGTPLVATINAISDALAPLGVTLVEGHAAPHDIWNLVQQAKAARAAAQPAGADSAPPPAYAATIGETTN